MKMNVKSAEKKKDKYDREYISLEFVNTTTGKVWRFWMWSWLVDYHTQAVYDRGAALRVGDTVDVLWKKAVYRGTTLQVITSMETAAGADFVWCD